MRALTEAQSRGSPAPAAIRACYGPPVDGAAYLPKRAMDTLVRQAPPTWVADFARGCAVVAALVAKERPGLVLYPGRGAGPLHWTARALLGGRHPQAVDLPIGSHRTGAAAAGRHLNDPPLAGLSRPRKKQVVEDALAALRASGAYRPGVTGVLLVDEVQNGGTLVEAARIVRQAMDGHGDTSALRVVAAQDQRPGVLSRPRSPRFAELAANNMPGVVAAVVPLMLFTVDRHTLLDRIEPDLAVTPNEDARQVFAAVAATAQDPAAALADVAALRAGTVPDSPVGAALAAALAGAHLVHPARRVDTAELLGYWEDLAGRLADRW